ncbi:MAG: hypothetical protein ACRDHG_13890, partial [Anaerolineales bacterium]
MDPDNPDIGAGAEPSWPETWREDYVAQIEDEGDREKRLRQLQRYDAPSSVLDAFFSHRQRLSSGEFVSRRPLSENATEDEARAWREERGLPLAPEDYSIPLADGVTFDALPEEAQQRISTIQQTFHEAHLTKEQAAKVMDTYSGLLAGDHEQTVDADAGAQDMLEDQLRSDWGGDYRNNIDLNLRFLDKEFPEIGPALMLARLPEADELGDLSGRRLVDLPIWNKFLNQMARAGGSEFLDAGDGGGAGATIDAQIAEIRGIMANDWAR